MKCGYIRQIRISLWHKSHTIGLCSLYIRRIVNIFYLLNVYLLSYERQWSADFLHTAVIWKFVYPSQFIVYTMERHRCKSLIITLAYSANSFCLSLLRWHRRTLLPYTPGRSLLITAFARDPTQVAMSEKPK